MRDQTILNAKRQAKVCRGCWELKPFSEFNSSKRCANGLRPRCKPCEAASAKDYAKRDPERYAEVSRLRSQNYRRNHLEKTKEKSRAYFRGLTTEQLRRHRLKAKYKMTPEQWDAMFLSQGSVCAICGTDTPGSSHGWHTDHDHATKRVRGILCTRCNHLLGNALDSPRVLSNAIMYLDTRGGRDVRPHTEPVVTTQSARPALRQRADPRGQ